MVKKYVLSLITVVIPFGYMMRTEILSILCFRMSCVRIENWIQSLMICKQDTMPCSLIINTNSLLLVSITMMSVMHFFEIGEMLMMSLLKKPMAGIQLLTR